MTLAFVVSLSVAVCAGLLAGAILRVLLRRRLGAWLVQAGDGWPWAGLARGRGRIESVAVCVALSLAYIPLGPSFIFGSLVLLSTLLLLAIIDLECGLLPDGLTLPLLWAGLLFNLWFQRVPLAEAVLGAAVGYVALWLLFWLFYLGSGREGLGYGDFKLLAAMGAWLGVSALPQVLLLSALTGLLAGGILMLLGRMQRNEALPFGPFLAFSGWMAWVGGERFQEWMTWQSRWWD